MELGRAFQMGAFIGERQRILKAKLQSNEFLKHSSWKDVMHELFKYYGRHKRAIRDRMKIEKEGVMQRVEIDGKAVYLPNGVDPKRLAKTYFQIYFMKNNHYYDIAEMEIKKGDIVLDCGASEGYFTQKALDCGAAIVYCVEPATALIPCLEKTFADEIDSGRVVLASCVFGNKNTVVGFLENPADPCAGQMSDAVQTKDKSIPVAEIPMFTIDEFCNQHSVQKLDFIKADVEGAEIDLLCGAVKTIRQFKPAIAIAVYHKPENANRIVAFIEGLSLNYAIRVKGIRELPGDRDKIPRPVMVHCYHKQ